MCVYNYFELYVFIILWGFKESYSSFYIQGLIDFKSWKINLLNSCI